MLALDVSHTKLSFFLQGGVHSNKQTKNFRFGALATAEDRNVFVKVYIFATFCPQFAQQSCPLITFFVVLGLLLCALSTNSFSSVVG